MLRRIAVAVYGTLRNLVFDPKLLDALLEGHGPQTLFANDGLVAQLKEALANRMLSAEMAQHLDTEADPDKTRLPAREFSWGYSRCCANGLRPRR